MKKTDDTKTLSLRREALKELPVEDLRHVAGGTFTKGQGRTSRLMIGLRRRDTPVGPSFRTDTTGGMGTRRIRYRAAVAIGAAIGSLGLLLAAASPAWAPGGVPWYPEAKPPTNIDQCKDGGWSAHTDGIGYAFANQGACVSYVASQGRSDHH